MEDCRELSECCRVAASPYPADKTCVVVVRSGALSHKTPKTATSVAVRIYLVGRVSEAATRHNRTS